MAGTSVPQPSFGPSGFIAPDEATEILPSVKNDINAALGGGLNMADETPQGQLAVSQASCIGNVNDLFIKLTQGVDPAYADGRMQDGIARIYFIERKGALATVVQATCTGLEGVVIPVGSLAQSVDGNLYLCTEAGVIPASGSIVLPFACVVLGPIACPSGSLTTIYQTISGWDSISNSADGILGRDTESRAEFEGRRYASVSKNSLGSLPSVRGEVLEIEGVTDVYVTENDTNDLLTKGGVSLIPNSLYVAVVGGNVSDVAEAIWRKKAPGCSYNGNTTVTIYDTSPGYNPPYPSYSVKFEVPNPLTILFSVTLKNNSGIPSNALSLIQSAVITAFAGADGGQRATIGADVLASRFYGPIRSLGSWAQIETIKIGSQNTNDADFTGTISGTSLIVSATASGVVAAGQSIIGNGVLPGTQIISGSGSSFVVNFSQTVVSGEMFGIVANQDIVSVNIDQVPVISSGDISLVLA